MNRKHSHYFRPCPYPVVDVYRILDLFDVDDPCLQHATKKLIAAGSRGGGKDAERDVDEAIDTLLRWKEMRTEERVAEEGRLDRILKSGMPDPILQIRVGELGNQVHGKP